MVLARNVGRAAMNGLEHSVVVADIRTPSNARHLPGRRTSLAMFAIQVREHNNVELAGSVTKFMQNASIRGRRTQYVLQNRPRSCGGFFQEQTIGELHDVRLVRGGHLFRGHAFQRSQNASEQCGRAGNRNRFNGNAQSGRITPAPSAAQKSMRALLRACLSSNSMPA